jgi:acetyl-CoA synthetase
MAKALKDQGVKKGDRVAVFLPVIPELPITLLATTRIGGVHTVVFSGFSAEALADRVNDCGAKILVTADGSFRRGKPVGIKDTADRAMPLMPNIEKVIVVKTHWSSRPNERRARHLVQRRFSKGRRKRVR